MCAECGHNPCVTRCPNATDRVTPHVCFYCKEPILLGEEFLTSQVGNAVHEDCFGYMDRGELFRFFGEKETCMVMRFVENVKPMVLNATNSKTITKLLKTPYIEHWKGRKIQIYIQEGVKAFGEVVDALRIRPFLPIEQDLTCADCGARIEGFGKSSADVVARHTLNNYGRMLCSACASKAAEAKKAEADAGVL